MTAISVSVKIRSVRFDLAPALRDKLAADIAALTATDEAANAEEADLQALPREIARGAVLKGKLDIACAALKMSHVAAEWLPTAPACNCRRPHNLASP